MPSITDFVANLTKNGLARPNRFLVTILPPSSLGFSQDAGRQLQFACEGASIPGATIETHDYRSYDMPVKVPGQKTFENVDLSFRTDRDFTELRFFKRWIDEIYDPNTGDVAYFDEIKGKVVISVLDNSGISRLKVELKDSYPISMSPVELNWGSNDEYVKLQVSFVYRYLEMESDNTSYSSISSTAPTSLITNASESANNAGNYSRSLLKNNIQTNSSGTKIPLNGILSV